MYSVSQIQNAIRLFSTLARSALGYSSCYEARKHKACKNLDTLSEHDRNFGFNVTLSLVGNVYYTRLIIAKRSGIDCTRKELLTLDLEILESMGLVTKNTGIAKAFYTLNKDFCHTYVGSLVEPVNHCRSKRQHHWRST